MLKWSNGGRQVLTWWIKMLTTETAEEDHYFATQVTPAAPLSGARSTYSVERCSITEGGNVCWEKLLASYCC